MAKLKNKKFLLIIIAFVFIFGFSVGQTSSYFVADTNASGVKVMSMEAQSEIIEEIDGLNKIVQVRNTGTSEIYVRVKALYPNNENIEVEISGKTWVLDDDGYYYYQLPLAANETTDKLNINVVVKKGYQKDFKIVVVQEYVIAVYDGNDANMEQSWEFGSIQMNDEGGDVHE